MRKATVMAGIQNPGSFFRRDSLLYGSFSLDFNSDNGLLGDDPTDRGFDNQQWFLLINFLVLRNIIEENRKELLDNITRNLKSG